MKWGLGVNLNLHSKYPFIVLNEMSFFFFYFPCFFFHVCTKCSNECFYDSGSVWTHFRPINLLLYFGRTISCWLPTGNRKRRELDDGIYWNKYMLQRVNEINYCSFDTVTFVSKCTSFFWNFQPWATMTSNSSMHNCLMNSIICEMWRI